MSYSWRGLQRLVADGPQDVLDIEATINQTTKQGFWLAPVYRRRQRNAAHLILLVDHGKSMVPFHRFTHDLVETARFESGLDEDLVGVYYFTNVPVDYLHHDLRMLERASVKELLSSWSSDTSILIISDAGATRGRRSRERIRATALFLHRLRQRTSLLAWLNPMPRRRWAGSSAEIIAHMVPSFQMDPDGLSAAIDVLRGQTPSLS
jgi:hypothetical protein